jgi:hypothetical protein
MWTISMLGVCQCVKSGFFLFWAMNQSERTIKTKQKKKVKVVLPNWSIWIPLNPHNSDQWRGYWESLTDFINTKIDRHYRSPHFGCIPHHAPSKFQPWKLCFISILWVEISYRFCTILTRLLRTLPSLETQRFLLDTTRDPASKGPSRFWEGSC